jgi:hypothetical protein
MAFKQSTEVGTMKDLFMPDWSQAPGWAVWHIVDADGTGYWFKEHPWCADTEWFWNGNGEENEANVQEFIMAVHLNDWRNSLRHRPDLQIGESR